MFFIKQFILLKNSLMHELDWCKVMCSKVLVVAHNL